ncbi:MAG TPA: PAS domain-containing protein [Archangium sp.]|nr:PAS domain-containing protein [Archangium sp.]
MARIPDDGRSEASAAVRIHRHKARIVAEWERRVRAELPAAQGTSHYVLLDSLLPFLDELIASLGRDAPSRSEVREVAEGHALQRSAIAGYDLDQLLAEYRILGQVLFEALDEGGALAPRERDVVLELLQSSKAAAARRYTELAHQREDRVSLALRQSEERLSLALRSASLGAWDWDVRGGALDWSDRLEELWGYEPGTFPGTIEGFWERIHPEDRQRVEQWLQAALDRRELSWEAFRVLRPDGSVVWVESQGQASYDPAGTPQRMAGVTKDVTERVRMSSALKETQERLEMALHAARVGIFDHDLGSARVHWTREAAEIFGVPSSRLQLDFAELLERVHADDRAGLEAFLTETIAARKQGYRTEFRVRWCDGSVHWVAITGRVVTGDRGEVARTLGTCMDVTDQRETERALRTSRRELEGIIQLSPFSMALFRGEEHLYALVNPAHDRMLGRRVQGKRIREAHTPEEAGNSPALLDRVYRTGVPYIGDPTSYTVRGEDGQARTFWLQEWFYPFHDAEGKVTGSLAVAQDITELVHARHAVERERERLYSTLMNAPVALAVLRGPELIFEFANDLYRSIHGSDRPLHGLRYDEAIPGLPPEHLALLKATYADGQPFRAAEFPATIDDGRNGTPSTRYWNVVIQPIRSAAGSVDSLMICASEVTSLVEARARIAESEARYREAKAQLELALESARMATWYVDLRTGRAAASRTLATILGLPETNGEVLETAGRFVHPEDRERVARVRQEALASGSPYFDEYRIVRPGGELRWVFSEGVVKRGADGAPASFSGVIGDITERAFAEARLEAERANFSRLFEQSSGFVAIFKGRELVYEYSNPTNDRIIGATVVGKALREVIPDAEPSGLLAIFLRVFETGEPETIHELPLEIGEETRYFDATYVARRDERGVVDGIMTWGVDVTAQVRARHELESALSRLESERDLRERFVATLTHDLRTPLTAAKMGAQLLARKASDPDAVLKSAVRIGESLDRADRMIRDLLDANRIRAGETLPIERASCDLAETARDTLEELMTVHGERFVLKGDRHIKGSWSCNAVRRILENLCINAVKYGAAGKCVTVTLTRAGQGAELQVHNEGPPIPSEELRDLFEPFRRAQSAQAGGQKGWGLGLTLVKGLAEAHGGSVSVSSTAESGTTFTVRLSDS